MQTTELIPRATLEDLVQYRLQALDLYRESLTVFVQAKTRHADACPQGHSISLPSDLGNIYLRANDVDEKMKEITTHLDRDMWRVLLTRTPLWSLMDKVEREKFEHSITTDPPVVTVDAVMATLTRLQEDSAAIFRRGIVNVFRELNRDYKSHDGFKLGDRIILEYAVEYNSWGDFSTYYRREDKLRDADRIMHVLDGREAPEYQQGLCAELRRLCREYKHTGEVELHTEYWKVKIFKNGNAHLWPLRPDLVDKANVMIAEHFGKALGDRTATGRTVRYQKRPCPGGDLGDYPSPAAVVKRVIELAMIDPGMKVLEPSAGSGNIACQAVAAGGLVDCVEYQARRVRDLESAGIYRSVTKGDWMDHPTVGVYDRVVMNPPFSRKADILHVMKAWGAVKSGGRLVAVMSQGALSGSHSLNKDFMALLDNGTWFDLPNGSFKESGTNVRTIVVVLDKEIV